MLSILISLYSFSTPVLNLTIFRKTVGMSYIITYEGNQKESLTRTIILPKWDPLTSHINWRLILHTQTHTHLRHSRSSWLQCHDSRPLLNVCRTDGDLTHINRSNCRSPRFFPPLPLPWCSKMIVFKAAWYSAWRVHTTALTTWDKFCQFCHFFYP